MTLYSYLARLQDSILSRQDISVHHLHIEPTSVGGILEAELSFLDGSRLVIEEAVERRGRHEVQCTYYKYHHQHADGTLIFRYDNAPHHPHLSTFPHHKHTGSAVASATRPDLSQVLREIDTFIYP